MKKTLCAKQIISLLILLSVLLVGCLNRSPQITTTPAPTGTTGYPIAIPTGSPSTKDPDNTSDQDAKTTPSIVNTNEAFELGISSEGPGLYVF